MTIAEIEKDLNSSSRELDLRPGDTARVHVRITEGTRTRIQVFEGTVIRIRKGGPRTTFTVRKVSFGSQTSGLLLPTSTRSGRDQCTGGAALGLLRGRSAAVEPDSGGSYAGCRVDD